MPVPSPLERSASTVCPEASPPFDAPEFCDGSSNECPADTGSAPTVSVVQRDGVLRLRRALALAGIALAILAPVSADAACSRDCDGIFACGVRECVGNSCVSFPEVAGTVCRAAAGVCDRAETCNGSSLSCPGDSKHGSTTVCRPAVDECDGAESCDGVSNDCTAPDVGVAPVITHVSILDSGVRFSDGGTNPNRFFEVRITGDQLCEATVDGAPLSNPLKLHPDASGNVVRNTAVYGAEFPDVFPSATYDFDVNRGAITGSLPYVAFDPDGPIEILSPVFRATLGGDPSFTVSNQCTNCGIQQLEVIENADVGTLATILTQLPIDTPVEIGLDDFSKGLAPLPEARYVFEAEAIAGTLVGETFAGDPLHSEFNYVSGRSIRNRLLFDVPEPGPGGAGATALVALLGLRRLRQSPDYSPGRSRAAGLGSELDLRVRELRAGRWALGAATRRRAGLAPAEDARPAVLPGPGARPRRVQGRAAPACMARSGRHEEFAEPHDQSRPARGL